MPRERRSPGMLVTSAISALIGRASTAVGRFDASRLSIDVPTVTYLHDLNDQLQVSDGVENAIDPLTYPIALLRGQLLRPMWSGILGERLNASQNPSDVAFLDSSKVFCSRGADDYFISCHRP